MTCSRFIEEGKFFWLCASRGLHPKFTGSESQADNERFINGLAQHPEKHNIGALFFEVDEIDLFLDKGKEVLACLCLACSTCDTIKVSMLAVTSHPNGKIVHHGQLQVVLHDLHAFVQSE